MSALSLGSPALGGAAAQEQHEQAQQQHSKSVVSREALARALRALAGRLEMGTDTERQRHKYRHIQTPTNADRRRQTETD